MKPAADPPVLDPAAAPAPEPRRGAVRVRMDAALGPIGSLRRRLVHAAIGSAGLKGLNMLLTSAVAIVLARTLRPEGYGIYSFATAICATLGVFSQVGLPTLLMREVARMNVQGRWGPMRGLLRRGNQATILMSVLSAGGAGAWVLWARGGSTSSEQLSALGWALFLLPLVSLGGLRSAALRGLGRVVQGQVPELLLRPLLLFLLLGGLLLLGGEGSLTPSSAMALNVAATGVAFVYGAVLLRRAIPRQVRAAAPSYDTAQWARSVVPLTILGGVQLLMAQVDILMLGALASAEDAGVYRVVAQLGNFVMVAAVVVNAVQAPYLARFYAEGDIARLRRLAQQGSRTLFQAALVIALVLVVFGRLILDVAVGPEYVRGYVALVIWCVGMVLTAEQGSLTTVMNMTGHERSTVGAMSLGLVSNVVLNLVAIPLWGITGAAAATMLSTLLWRSLLRRETRRKLGFTIGAIGSMRER
jgi:O-antigen/teichoic acid export membrane protein